MSARSLVVACAAIGVLLTPSARADCSALDVSRLTREAATVFRGRVLAVGPVRRPENPEDWTTHAVVTFQILEAWKGRAQGTVEVAEVVDEGDLSPPLMHVGEEWVVFAFEAPRGHRGRIRVVPRLPADAPTNLAAVGCDAALPIDGAESIGAQIVKELRAQKRNGGTSR